MAENFPNQGNKTNIQVQEAQKIPNKIKLKRSMPRHVKNKVSEAKES